jgi:hypothetical protein
MRFTSRKRDQLDEAISGLQSGRSISESIQALDEFLDALRKASGWGKVKTAGLAAAKVAGARVAQAGARLGAQVGDAAKAASQAGGKAGGLEGAKAAAEKEKLPTRWTSGGPGETGAKEVKKAEPVAAPEPKIAAKAPETPPPAPSPTDTKTPEPEKPKTGGPHGGPPGIKQPEPGASPSADVTKTDVPKVDGAPEEKKQDDDEASNKTKKGRPLAPKSGQCAAPLTKTSVWGAPPEKKRCFPQSIGHGGKAG